MTTINRFRTEIGANVFFQKYAQGGNDSWDNLAIRLVDDVCGTMGNTLHPILSLSERDQLTQYVKEMKFIPGGRYLYYAGRKIHAWNNCFLLKCEEDTREEWANILWRASSCLMLGGGIGVDYSVLRPSGRTLSRTGGVSSGPVPLMQMVNEVGRFVMQGGSRRSAIYASLNHKHEDIWDFLKVKNWDNYPVAGTNLAEIKKDHFNFPAPLDMTNISVNYDNSNLIHRSGTGSLLEFDSTNKVFQENCRQAMMTGEPGFSFNFGAKENETLRNAPVAGRTRILTDKGYRTVEDVVGEEIHVWTGKQFAKTVFKKTKEDVNLVEVVLSNGRSIFCDPEHPFITWNKSGTERVPAQSLEEGQGLVCDLPINSMAGMWEPTGIRERLRRYYGYGFVYGDGSIKNQRGEISYHTETKRACFEQACRDLDAHKGGQENRAYFKTDYSCKVFIPNREFVAGWFDADGCVCRDTLRLSCKDEGALFELQEYFDCLGIKSSVRQDGCSGYAPENNVYTLTVFKESFNTFSSLFDTLRLEIPKTGKCRKQNVLVKKVLQTPLVEDVYCCDVGVEEHAFMAEGVIVSNCTEVTSEDDSDVCNLGSINLGNIETLDEFKAVVCLASKFLVCGTIRADLPYEKVKTVREKNRRLGLGLMGIHEWLLKRGSKYEVTPELHKWLQVYKDESEQSANQHCDRLYLSRPVAYRAIAPTGTIGILAGTTTGIEPLFAVAYKRRYLTEGTKWKYEYVIDHTADLLIKETGVSPDKIDTAYNMAGDYEKRIKFQADVQDYIDMSISSTINLPAWGSKGNDESSLPVFTKTLARYAHRLRGFTCYPDGSRGGQPITEVPYDEARGHKGVVFEESDPCVNGVCGV